MTADMDELAHDIIARWMHSPTEARRQFGTELAAALADAGYTLTALPNTEVDTP